MHIRGLVYLLGIFASQSRDQRVNRTEFLKAWNSSHFVLTKEIIHSATKDIRNRTLVGEFIQFVEKLNKSFDYDNESAIWKKISLVQTGEENTPEYKPVSGNPHCDAGEQGPQRVTREVSGTKSANPFNAIPTFTIDMAEITTDLLNRASGPAAAQAGMTGIIAMAGIMMVKDMVQSAASTAASIVPPMIPPPAWNNMPMPCTPMVTGGNCFGSVLFPITFADSLIADVTDSLLTGMREQFRSTFVARAGIQPDAVYQTCFKAYMSLMCSSLFPMCTNPQGRDEMIPFVGRVPTCFTACIAVMASCPGFTLADIEGPCSEVSVPPLCSQAVYLRDDPQSVSKLIEEDIANRLNSKCANYEPELDAGDDPLLYEEEPTEKMFHSYHDMQVMFS